MIDRSLGIVSLYFSWHYDRGLRALLRIAENYVFFAVHLFSIPSLLETLLEPWKQITVPPSGTLFSQEQLTAIWTNIISRTLGMIVRTCTIVVGVFFVLLVVLLALVGIGLWLAAPAIPLVAIFLGLRLFTLG